MTTNWIFKLSMLMCLAVTACTSSDNDKPTPPAFPEKQTLTVEVGQTAEVEFDASQEWRMTSDKPWVRFLVGEGEQTEELPIAYGDAGQNIVKIVMKDNGFGFEPEVASLNLTMSNFSQVVFEVTRPANVRETQMLLAKTSSGSVDPIEALDMPYTAANGYRIAFLANYDWKIISWPDWLSPMKNLTGEANAAIPAPKDMNLLSVNLEARAYEKMGEVILADRSGTQQAAFPITFAGMDGDKVTIVPSVKQGITFTYDGKIDGSGSVGGGEVTDETERVLKITTRNMEYKIAIVTYDLNTFVAREIAIDSPENWVTCTRSTEVVGQLSVSLNQDNNTNADRILYVYILPPTYMTAPGYDYSKDFDEDWFSSTIGFRVTQSKKPLTEGFVLKSGLTSQLLAAPVKLADANLVAQYGTDNIYQKTFTQQEWTAGGSIQILPHGLQKGFLYEFANSNAWAANVAMSTDKIAISNRVAFDRLPSTQAPIIFKKQDGSVYGVLFISK